MWKLVIFVAATVSILENVSCKLLQIADGEIIGTILQTRLGTDFYAFRKIPYAQPPVGRLRFRAPKPVKPWSGTLDCTAYGPVCSQLTTLPTSEDCLHLNVFSKNLPTDGHSNLKPVIVWIQGGGNLAGSPRDYGPDNLLDRDIVLVNFNYRLGALGFLALETDDIPGNAALKDQNLVLRWVKSNIQSFGGDPQRVTVAGISSGSYSITAHLLSPMSQGLFHNVILTSGALTFNQKMKTNNFHLAEQVAERVNCTTASVGAMVQCLENTSAEDLASASLFSYFYCPIQVWLPVIEKKSVYDRHRDRFLTDQPDTLLRNGKFARVNIMLGTADEIFSSAANILASENRTEFLNENFNEIAPICFAYEDANGHTANEISAMLREFYFPYGTIDVRQSSLLHQIFVDSMVGHRVHKMTRFTRDLTNVYYYKITYIGRFSRLTNSRNLPYGVAHGDDTQYVFYPNIVQTAKFLPTDPENLMVERLTRIWEQFASTGNPNNPNDKYLGEMVWPLHDSVNEFYLDIGNNMVEKHGKELKEMIFWDNIFNPY